MREEGEKGGCKGEGLGFDGLTGTGVTHAGLCWLRFNVIDY